MPFFFDISKFFSESNKLLHRLRPQSDNLLAHRNTPTRILHENKENMKTETITFRATAEEKERIEAAAKANGLTMTTFILECIAMHSGQLALIERFAMTNEHVAPKYALSVAVSTILARHYNEMTPELRAAWDQVAKVTNEAAAKATAAAYQHKKFEVSN